MFEPLVWFALLFLLLFVLRPAWDLWHENFIYTGRLISPTFTKMLVAGLLAGTGFVIGYLTPPAGSLAARIPRPAEPGASPAADLVDDRAGGRLRRLPDLLRRRARMARPGGLLLPGRGSPPAPRRRAHGHQQVLPRLDPADGPRGPVLPVHSTQRRRGRRASGASPDGPRSSRSWRSSSTTSPPASVATWSVMVGALAVYYYLRRGRRPSVLSLVRRGPGGADGCLRRARPPVRARPTRRAPIPFSGCRGTPRTTCSRARTRAWPPPWPPRCWWCPASSTTPTARRPCSGRSSRSFPGSCGRASPRPPTRRSSPCVWGGTPCGYRGQCSTFSPVRGALSRRRPRRGVPIRGAVRRLLEGGLALLPSSPGHHGGDRRLLRAAAVHDHLDARKLHPPGPQVAMVLAVVVLGAVLCRREPAAPVRSRRTAIPSGSRSVAEA